MARQLVVHGHIVVNGRRMNIPSHRLKIGDTFGVRDQSVQKGPFAEIAQNGTERQLPGWVEFDTKQFSGRIAGEPAGEVEPTFDPSLVLEFYSR
jgi:small subunit ribosomal protein S4